MLFDQPVIKTATVQWDTTNKRTAVSMSVNTVDEGIDILCEGMIVIMRLAHKHGASNKQMQEHLNKMKLRVWNGVIDNIDNPDIAEQVL